MSEAAQNYEEGVEGAKSYEEPVMEAKSIWNAKTMDRVREFAQTYEDVKEGRDALNAKLAAGKTALIDEGFNKDALDAAMKYARTPETKRENFDLTYLYCRKALGVPVQDDLFSAAVQQHVRPISH